MKSLFDLENISAAFSRFRQPKKYSFFQAAINARWQLLLKATTLGVFSVYLLDVIAYHGFVAKNFLSPHIILFLVAALQLQLRLSDPHNKEKKLSDSFVQTQFFAVIPTVLGLSLIAYYLEEFGLLFPNYFYTNFQLHYVSLVWIAFQAFVLGSIQASSLFWQRYWRSLVTAATSFLIITAGVVYHTDEILYRSLVKEDDVVEYLTALFFLISGVISFSLIAKKSVFKQQRLRQIFAVGCIIVGLILCIVAGEEISWGQRIFGIETPEIIAQQNRQGEITIHNSEFFWPYVYILYALVGSYGMTVWIIEWLIKDVLPSTGYSVIWRKILIPGGYLFFNFSLIVLYVWLRNLHGPWKYQLWEEYAELLLVLGVMIHLIEVKFYLNRIE